MDHWYGYGNRKHNFQNKLYYRNNHSVIRDSEERITWEDDTTTLTSIPLPIPLPMPSHYIYG